MVSDDVLADWHALAEQYGAVLLVIECVCSDESVHRSRVEGRVRAIPGWHEVDWDHVQRMRTELPQLRVDRLVIDAATPLEANTASVLAYVRSARQP